MFQQVHTVLLQFTYNIIITGFIVIIAQYDIRPHRCFHPGQGSQKGLNIFATFMQVTTYQQSICMLAIEQLD